MNIQDYTKAIQLTTICDVTNNKTTYIYTIPDMGILCNVDAADGTILGMCNLVDIKFTKVVNSWKTMTFSLFTKAEQLVILYIITEAIASPNLKEYIKELWYKAKETPISNHIMLMDEIKRLLSYKDNFVDFAKSEEYIKLLNETKLNFYEKEQKRIRQLTNSIESL